MIHISHLQYDLFLLTRHIFWLHKDVKYKINFLQFFFFAYPVYFCQEAKYYLSSQRMLSIILDQMDWLKF